ncbi:MAG: hypothetical protein GY953_11730 [bacterium]|nr:hypothetical protein [bacterium]
MLASMLIITVSLVLFLYWFRYTCILILNTRTTKDYSADVAEANQLSFVGVRNMIEESRLEDLDTIQNSLERDYQLVCSLMKQTGQLHIGGSTLEDGMLRVDFRLMRMGYSIARRVSESRSRAALEEMSLIVAHFANSFGEKAAGSARA